LPRVSVLRNAHVIRNVIHPPRHPVRIDLQTAHRLAERRPFPTAWRVEQAKVAMSDPSIAIALVAERVGYKSEAAFSRAFKKLAGVGPGQYRTRHRGGE
jgi:AraC-like DNA-binding protein